VPEFGGENPRKSLAEFMTEWRQRREAHEETGERLLAERNDAIRAAYAAGVTQTEIAEVVGLRQQYVSRILRAP
jgi:DNA-directed RNA polymerase specialized sigma subunit